MGQSPEICSLPKTGHLQKKGIYGWDGRRDTGAAKWEFEVLGKHIDTRMRIDNKYVWDWDVRVLFGIDRSSLRLFGVILDLAGHPDLKQINDTHLFSLLFLGYLTSVFTRVTRIAIPSLQVTATEASMWKHPCHGHQNAFYHKFICHALLLLLPPFDNTNGSICFLLKHWLKTLYGHCFLVPYLDRSSPLFSYETLTPTRTSDTDTANVKNTEHQHWYIYFYLFIIIKRKQDHHC